MHKESSNLGAPLIRPCHRPPRNGPTPPNPPSTARNLIPGTGSPGNRPPPPGVHCFRIRGTKRRRLPLNFGAGVSCILRSSRIFSRQWVGDSAEKGIVPLVEKVRSIQLASGYSTHTSRSSGRINRRGGGRGSCRSGRSWISSSGSGFESRNRHYACQNLDLQKGGG